MKRILKDIDRRNYSFYPEKLQELRENCGNNHNMYAAWKS